MSQEIAQRLKALRLSLDYSAGDFGARIGEKEQRVRDIERGQQRAPGEYLAKVVELFQVGADWLLLGRGPMRMGTAEDPAPYTIHPATEWAADYVQLPFYCGVQAAAGAGAIPPERPEVTALAFRRDWIRQALGVSPRDLCLITVDGESMTPTLCAGDVILVDGRAGAASVDRDGVYVLRVDGALLVKRVQRLPGRLRVASDNAAYAPFEVAGGEPDLAVIGRVVWAGRRM